MRTKGTGYLSSPEAISKLKSEMAEYIKQGKSKTWAVSELAGKYFMSEATMWERLKG